MFERINLRSNDNDPILTAPLQASSQTMFLQDKLGHKPTTPNHAP